jgi:hypothetical protein
MRHVAGNELDLEPDVDLKLDAPTYMSDLNELVNTDAMLAYGYGYGYGGFARAAIPLAAIVGLTVIGASALGW